MTSLTPARLLACDSCQFGADNGASMDDHTRAKHERPASRQERTPRSKDRPEFADRRSLLECMAALGAPVAGAVERGDGCWLWCHGASWGEAVSELAAVQALIRHHRKDAA